MKLLLLNDLHIGKTRESTTRPGFVRQANSEAADKLRDVVSSLKHEQFDLVFQMGDILRDTLDEAIDKENIRTGLTILSDLPFKTIHLLGNHELMALSREKLTKVFEESGIHTNFYGSIDFPDLQVVWLDVSLDENRRAYLPQERITWLKQTLSPTKSSIILTHYGFLPQNTNGSFYFEENSLGISLLNGPEVWQEISHFPIKAIINAHVHWCAYSKSDHTHMITIPAFTEIITQNSTHDNPGIYSVLDIQKNKLILKSFSTGFCFFNLELDFNQKPTPLRAAR